MANIEITFKKLSRSQRAIVENIEFDVWAVGEVDGNRARWSALDTNSGEYLGGGFSKDIEVAKEMIDLFI